MITMVHLHTLVCLLSKHARNKKMCLFPSLLALIMHYTGDFSAAYKWGGKIGVRPKVGGGGKNRHFEANISNFGQK